MTLDTKLCRGDRAYGMEHIDELLDELDQARTELDDVRLELGCPETAGLSNLTDMAAVMACALIEAKKGSEWCKKTGRTHITCRGQKRCLPWYRRWWGWAQG